MTIGSESAGVKAATAKKGAGTGVVRALRRPARRVR